VGQMGPLGGRDLQCLVNFLQVVSDSHGLMSELIWTIGLGSMRISYDR